MEQKFRTRPEPRQPRKDRKLPRVRQFDGDDVFSTVESTAKKDCASKGGRVGKRGLVLL